MKAAIRILFPLCGLCLFLSLPLRGQGAEACGVCHGKNLEQWQDSPHARAWAGELFQEQLSAFGSAQFCGRCHAPRSVWEEADTRPDQEDGSLSLESKSEEEELSYNPVLADVPNAREKLLEEGVSCGSCHLVQVFSPVGKREDFVGPYHTSKGHGGKEVSQFARLRLCGTCHGRSPDIYRPEGGTLSNDFHHSRAVRVEFDYMGSDCAGCHMPRSEGKLVTLRAFGELPDRRVGNHSFTGERFEKLSEALTIGLVTEGSTSSAIRLVNESMGHPLGISSNNAYKLRLTLDQETHELPLSHEQLQSLEPGSALQVDLPFPVGTGQSCRVEFILERENAEPRVLSTSVLEP